MENFINTVLENVKNAILNGDLEIEDFMREVGCLRCPLHEACAKAADEGDSRECGLFIRDEAK